MTDIPTDLDIIYDLKYITCTSSYADDPSDDKENLNNPPPSNKKAMAAVDLMGHFLASM